VSGERKNQAGSLIGEVGPGRKQAAEAGTAGADAEASGGGGAAAAAVADGRWLRRLARLLKRIDPRCDSRSIRRPARTGTPGINMLFRGPVR